MSDPSSFLNWQDYLGLNEGVGETMANRTLEEADKLGGEARSAADARVSSAGRAGETGDLREYERAGERSRKALTSYGEFMQALKDPGARRTLMEKVYGKGAVSARDSAMMGAQGGARMAAEKDKFNQTQRYAEERDMVGERQMGESKAMAGKYAENEAGYQRNKQAAADAREDDRLNNEYAMQYFDDEGRGPGANMLSEAEKKQQIYYWSKHSKSRGADGKIDWNKYRRARDQSAADWEAGTAGDVQNWGIVKDAGKFFTGLGGGSPGGAPKQESWKDYSAKNRRAVKPPSGKW